MPSAVAFSPASFTHRSLSFRGSQTLLSVVKTKESSHVPKMLVRDS